WVDRVSHGAWSLPRPLGPQLNTQFNAGRLRAGLRRPLRPLRRLIHKLSSSVAERSSLKVGRPVVVIQSDDWGRVGAPSVTVLRALNGLGLNVGRSPWDYYGLESQADLIELGDLLTGVRDRDGRSACFTANFVLANADLRRMRSEGYEQ